MFGPGIIRGIIGMIVFSIIFTAVFLFLRVVVAGLPVTPTSGPTPTLVFAGFGAAVGWLWGVGSFNPKLSAHGEAPVAAPTPTERRRPGLIMLRKATAYVFSLAIPLIKPLIVALVVCVVAVGIFMVVGMIPATPGLMVQTNNANASTMTVNGNVSLPFNDANNKPIQVNKGVMFVIVAVVVLGLLGGLALVLALIMNALSKNVQEAKQMPNSPPKTEPLLFRLIDFFVTWVNDILAGTRHSVTR